jgi:hypothetical protein
MKKIILLLAFTLTACSFAAGQSTDKCFKSDWLQQSHTITYKVTGSVVSGGFTVEGDDGVEKVYDFTGTVKGSVLTVKFKGGKLPDISPSEMKGLVWTLGMKGTEEILKIKVYGKNYETNKYATSDAEYESCTPSYAKLATMAKPVMFAKGTNSSKMKLSFADNDEMKVFLINVRKGQALETVAYGCSISIYLPDKKLYYEDENPGQVDSGKTSTVLDVSSILEVPQTGNYLILLKNAGGDPTRSREVELKVIN